MLTRYNILLFGGEVRARHLVFYVALYTWEQRRKDALAVYDLYPVTAARSGHVLSLRNLYVKYLLQQGKDKATTY